MIIDKKCKVCRRAGEKLFLKGEKCFTPQCTLEKKPYTPGKLGPMKRRRPLSDFGKQLLEKQKVRNIYRIQEGQFSNYVKSASEQKGVSPKDALYQTLESRLDNVIYRLGLAGTSRALARQIVSHGHVFVNGKRISIPSHRVRKGDVISVRPQSAKKPLFEQMPEKIKNVAVPPWLSRDATKLTAEVKNSPTPLEHEELLLDLGSVIEFYSR